MKLPALFSGRVLWAVGALVLWVAAIVSLFEFLDYMKKQ